MELGFNVSFSNTWCVHVMNKWWIPRWWWLPLIWSKHSSKITCEKCAMKINSFQFNYFRFVIYRFYKLPNWLYALDFRSLTNDLPKEIIGSLGLWPQRDSAIMAFFNKIEEPDLTSNPSDFFCALQKKNPYGLSFRKLVEELYYRPVRRYTHSVLSLVRRCAIEKRRSSQQTLSLVSRALCSVVTRSCVLYWVVKQASWVLVAAVAAAVWLGRVLKIFSANSTRVRPSLLSSKHADMTERTGLCD